jgi:hypothetical protein
MIQLNAAARLEASDEGVADLSYYVKKINNREIVIVEGQGQRFQAGRLPNGKYCVLDMGGTGRSPGLAFGLDGYTARNAAREANQTGKWHPTMTMRQPVRHHGT